MQSTNPSELTTAVTTSFLPERPATSNVMNIAIRRRGTIEVLNPNVESGGGPFARGRAQAMGVWRTPKSHEYANPEGLIDRKVRVYFDGDCTYFEAQVCTIRT